MGHIYWSIQVNNKASEQNGNGMSSFLTLKKLMPNALGTGFKHVWLVVSFTRFNYVFSRPSVKILVQSQQ